MSALGNQSLIETVSAVLSHLRPTHTIEESISMKEEALELGRGSGKEKIATTNDVVQACTTISAAKVGLVKLELRE